MWMFYEHINVTVWPKNNCPIVWVFTFVMVTASRTVETLAKRRQRELKQLPVIWWRMGKYV